MQLILWPQWAFILYSVLLLSFCRLHSICIVIFFSFPLAILVHFGLYKFLFYIHKPLVFFTNAAPSTPRNLTLIVESNTTILVTWFPPENKNGIISEYNIQVMEGVNSSWQNINITGNATYMIVNNLKPYTNYSFRIQARTIRDWGNFSETKTHRTLEGRTYASLLYFQYFMRQFTFCRNMRTHFSCNLSSRSRVLSTTFVEQNIRTKIYIYICKNPQKL